MTENIELRSLNGVFDGEIEEYHEITQETRETAFLSSISADPVSSYEFFTNNDSKHVTKVKNKKKNKIKDKSHNLMDIISSELANLAIPIKENAIEKVNEKEHSPSYLLKYTRISRKLFRRKIPCYDYEYGFNHASRANTLSPVFPRILENASIGTIPLIPTEFINANVFKDFINENSQTNHQVMKRFLDIQLQNLKFLHHHHYSLENLLCLKLLQYYDEYGRLEKVKKELAREIAISRETKYNIKKDLIKASPKKKDEVRFDETLRKYTLKLLQLKNKKIKLDKEHKEVIHTLISIWSDIEMIREKAECSETPYNLVINKESVSKKDYERTWNETYEEEFMDMLDKVEYDYVTKYIEYKEIKTGKSLDSHVKNKISKPKLKIKEDIVKGEVEELVNNIVKREKLHIKVEKNGNIDLNSKRNKYYFEIYVDNVFVCESESYSSYNTSFDVEIDESFSVEILNNELLTIVLLENETKLGQVDIRLSNIETNNDKNDLLKLVFEYKNIVQPSFEHVGNGSNIKEITAVNKVRLKCSNIFKGKLTTACEVKVVLNWSNDVKENYIDAIKASMEIGKKLSRLMHGIDSPNTAILIDVISRIYGKNMSEDENMIKTIRNLCKQEKQFDEKFYIDENSADFTRFKLLHLRNSGGFANVVNKMVPLHGSQISTEHLDCLQQSKEKEFDVEYLREKEAFMDPIELQRFLAVKYIQKLNKKVIKNLNEHLMVKTQKDVIREFRDFSLRSIFTKNNTDNMAFISNCTKQELLMEAVNKEQEIQITIVRAFNLLDRTTALMEESENDDEMEIAGYKVRPLRPFVRVSYHGESEQTVTGIGCHPTWNHTLKLSTKLDPLSLIQIDVYDEYKENISDGSEDQATNTVHYRYFNKWLGTAQIPIFTVLSLGAVRGTFKISSPPLLFGYETLQNKDSTSLIPEITQLMKKEVAYITMHITTSLSHLGGFQAYNQPLPSTIEDDYLIKHLNNFVADYLNDFPERNISLTFIDSAGRNRSVTQFLQPIPLPSREYFPKNPKSLGSAMSKSSGFSRSSSSSGPKREVDLGANEERESEYSQESWKKDSLNRTMNACLRYVALIPSYEVSDTHVVTLMGLELLKLLYGTPLDHTLLLASYFLYLGIRCYIAIGLSIPRGRSSFVLIQYDLATRKVVTNDQVVRKAGFLSRGDGYLWYVCDAVSGERHELRDVGCPLKTVDYVFDNENIWVNVQSSQDCESLLLDFSKSSEWQAVFDPSIFVLKHPVVTDASIYSPPSNVENLRQALEAKIKTKVQKWRALRKTIWNRYCSGLLREALLYWEYWAFNPNENKPPFNQKLKQLCVTYKVFSFPLNLPFTNSKSLISAIKSTGLHVNDDPNVEFALAVEVYAYPNNVVSVWLFFASVTRI